VNYVTIPSTDLGELLSVTVQQDNSGNAPNWCLDRIVVTSSFFQGSKVAVFNMEIVGNTPEIQSFL
jgi:PLAT/LH2 domain